MTIGLPAVGSTWRTKHGQSYGRQKRWCLVISVWVTPNGFGRVRTAGGKRSTLKLTSFLRDYEKISDPTSESRRDARDWRNTRG